MDRVDVGEVRLTPSADRLRLEIPRGWTVGTVGEVEGVIAYVWRWWGQHGDKQAQAGESGRHV